jgi:alkylation response protein AidB-like acyl-CoA dehydrogenase
MPAFAVPPEHADLRAAVRLFLTECSPEAEVRRLMETATGHDPAVWKRMAGELGLQGLIVPAAHGGAGAGRVELGIVLEEAGRALLCAPLFATVALAATLLLESGDTEAQARYLPGIAAGETVATVAVSAADPARRPPGSGVAAAAAAEGWRLTGEEPYVVDGHAADLLLVPARTPAGPTLFAVARDAPGLVRTPLRTVDRTRRQARVTFAATPAERIGPEGAAGPVLGRTLDLAAVALAAEQAGAAAFALERTVAYAKQRVQFGRPIGGFQAIKHLLADLLLESESAISAARWAAAAADEGDPDLPALASLVRAYCSDAFVRIAADSIQIHGGVGFTWEHAAHLYLRRARTSAQLLGDAAYHRERYLQRSGAVA